MARKPQVKMGSRVRIRATGEIAYVHANQRGKPYPFYLHEQEDVPAGTPLRGPYGREQLELA